MDSTFFVILYDTLIMNVLPVSRIIQKIQTPTKTPLDVPKQTENCKHKSYYETEMHTRPNS